jgi:hypothetical protein
MPSPSPGAAEGTLPSNPAGAVHGTLIVAALLAAESARNETYADTVGAVAIALLLYWLAHSYAEVTARRLQKQEALTLDSLVETMVHELTIILGAAVPLLTLLIWWAAGGSLSGAVTAAIWTAVGVIIVTEAVIGVRAELPRKELIVQTAFGATLGALVIGLRLLLH